MLIFEHFWKYTSECTFENIRFYCRFFSLASTMFDPCTPKLRKVGLWEYKDLFHSLLSQTWFCPTLKTVTPSMILGTFIKIRLETLSVAFHCISVILAFVKQELEFPLTDCMHLSFQSSKSSTKLNICYSAPSRQCHLRSVQVHGAHQAASHIPAFNLSQP